jgi:PAS domain S-box-containing protein
VTSTGKSTPIRLSCELLHEGGREIGTIGFFHDISGRLALQSNLAESEEKFRTLFETASDAILSIDENGLILMGNRAAKDIFEYPGQEIVGLDVRRLLGSGQEGAWEVLARYASRSESGKYVESSAVSRSGKKIPFHISVSESTHGGKRFYSTIMRDVSQIKAYEEDLQVLANTGSRFPMPPGGQPVSVTVSIGIAGYRNGDTLDDVIRHADLAMYAAKSGGRNRVVNYDHLTIPAGEKRPPG